MQSYFSTTKPNHTEKSNITYIEVKDTIADSKDTILSMLHNLYTSFIIDQNQTHLVVEGDAKVFDTLQSLKHEYGEDLNWVVPYPGDWHALKNYQIALMKAYLDAGLKDLARVAGYPTAQIQSCGHFKRVHNFLLEAWEALYRVLVSLFLEQHSSDQIHDQLFQALKSTVRNSSSDFQKEFNLKVMEITKLETIKSTNFKLFLDELAEKDDTCRFWIRFVFEDAMAYMGFSWLYVVETGY